MVLCRFHFKCYYRQIIPQPCVVVDLIRTFNRWESLFLQTKGVHEKKSTEDGKSERYTHFFNSRKEADTPALIASATDDVSQSELLIVENEMKKLTQVKKKRITNVPEKIETEVGTYALNHGTKAALERFNKIYPKYTFLRTSINNWKFKIKKVKELL